MGACRTEMEQPSLYSRPEWKPGCAKQPVEPNPTTADTPRHITVRRGGTLDQYERSNGYGLVTDIMRHASTLPIDFLNDVYQQALTACCKPVNKNIDTQPTLGYLQTYLDIDAGILDPITDKRCISVRAWTPSSPTTNRLTKPCDIDLGKHR